MKQLKTNLSHYLSIVLLLVCPAGHLLGQGANSLNPNRRYDEVSWLITHNAYNNNTDGPQGFWGCLGGRNQGRGIRQQLEDGVRSFMVDIYRVNGALRLKHGFPNMCMMDAKDFNNILGNWLATHPRDIITLHIESGPNLGIAGLDDIFFGRRGGYQDLSGYIYDHKAFSSPGRPVGAGSDVYPTLNEMASQNKRLAIFTETNYNSDLYRYEFAHTAQNPYRAGQVKELYEADKFRVDRGVDHKTVLTVNHFAGDAPFYNGDANKSKDANQSIVKKALDSWHYFGRRPSIAVDYYHLSHSRPALGQINEVNTYNEVRGRFIDPQAPDKHIRGVEAYLARWENGRWQKTKDIGYQDKRAKWHLFYSFPARVGDKRALFFTHPHYHFSPTHVKIADFAGDQGMTHVVDVAAAIKGSAQYAKATKGRAAARWHIVRRPGTPGRYALAYHAPAKAALRAGLFDLRGRPVCQLVDETVLGHGEVAWPMAGIGKGVYLVKGHIGGHAILRKVFID